MCDKIEYVRAAVALQDCSRMYLILLHMKPHFKEAVYLANENRIDDC